MNAIDFEERNVEIAKEQEEYATLPAYAQHEGIVTYCMQLDEEEVKKVTSKKTAYVRFLNFGTPVQPVAFSIFKPKLPIDYRSKTESTPFGWQPVEEGASSPLKELAACDFMELKDLLKREVAEKHLYSDLIDSCCTLGIPFDIQTDHYRLPWQ